MGSFAAQIQSDTERPAHPEDLGLEPKARRALAEAWSAGLPDEVRACLATLPPGAAAAPLPGELAELLAPEPTPAGVLHLVGRTPGSTEGAETGSQVGSRLDAWVSLTVVPQGEAPAGPRVAALLRDAVQRMARDEPTLVAGRVQAVAARLLPPWAEGLEHLGDLRWALMARTAVALDHAERIGASTAILLTHEIVSLGGSKEARRRNNREDLDRFVRRLSGGEIPRLQRGVLAGPLPFPGPVSLYLGKVRRDLA